MWDGDEREEEVMQLLLSWAGESGALHADPGITTLSLALYRSLSLSLARSLSLLLSLPLSLSLLLLSLSVRLYYFSAVDRMWHK